MCCHLSVSSGWAPHFMITVYNHKLSYSFLKQTVAARVALSSHYLEKSDASTLKNISKNLRHVLHALTRAQKIHSVHHYQKIIYSLKTKDRSVAYVRALKISQKDRFKIHHHAKQILFRIFKSELNIY